MMIDCFDRAHRQYRTQRKGHIRRTQRIECNGGQTKRQPLSAKFGRRIDCAPAVGDIRLICRDKALWHHDLAVDQPRADGIADPVQRGKLSRRKFADTFDNCLHHIGRRVGKTVMSGQRIDAGDVLQYEQLLGDGCGEGHGL